MYKPQQKINSFLGNFVYDQTIPTDHFLKKVDDVIDFSFIDELCKDVYQVNGRGRKPYQPSLLFKMLFLGFVYDISDRELEDQVNDRFSFKWFLGLSVDEASPDHSTLSIFRERLGVDRFREIFNEIVGIAKDRGLTDEKLKMVDATHILADANYHKAKEKGDGNNTPPTSNSSDPDARIGFKRKDKPFYGYKSHQRIDTKVGIVEKIIVTPGNESDTIYLPDLIDDLEPDTAVTADQAYETDYHDFICAQKKLKPYMAIKSNRKDYHKEKRKSDPQYQAALKLRSLYERTFGEAKQWHGMRRCRWRNRWKTEIQCLMTASVQNIKRIVVYANDPPRLHPLYEQYFS